MNEKLTSKKIYPFFFDNSFLEDLLSKNNSFLTNKPFPHVVIENFLPNKIAETLANEFPGPNEASWTVWGPGNVKNSNDKNIEKIGTSDEENFNPFTRHFFSQLNSQNFLSFIKALTGRDNIICDPYYKGGGLHSTGKGGRLMVHTDSNRHPIRDKKLHQVINLILFLNKDWKEEYGGHLELWNSDASKSIVKILPIFNRCVIFETNSKSYHGQPIPLNCPDNRRRNSLAIYYYELNRAFDHNYNKYQHSTKWVGTTDEDKSFFNKNWKEVILTKFNNFKFLIRDFIPPVIIKILKK